MQRRVVLMLAIYLLLLYPKSHGFLIRKHVACFYVRATSTVPMVQMGGALMGRRSGGHSGSCSSRYPCNSCSSRIQREINSDGASSSGGTMRSSAFRDVPQRSDSAVTNTFFNGPGDGASHGHVKYRNNADGTTDYLYARDVEGNEYDV